MCGEVHSKIATEIRERRRCYSRSAFNKKRSRGVWLEGKHWTRAPDGRVWVNWRAIEKWVEGKDSKAYE